MIRTGLCTAALALLLLTAQVAAAAPVGSTVLLAFGDTYRAADGGDALHRGADVACASGEAVEAPLGGTVTFVGSVPGAGGETMLAMTIRSGDDLLTMMPLIGASVRRGDTVDAGDRVASVADAGDVSSNATHLHVSLRRSGVYLDPAPLLCAAGGGTGAASPEPVTGQVPTAVPAGAVSASAPSVVVAGTQLAPGVSVGGQPVVAASAQVAHASEAVQAAVRVADPSGATAVPGDIAPGVSLSAPTPVAQNRCVSETGPSVATRLVDAAGRAGETVGRITDSPWGLAAIAAAMGSVGLLLSRRALERRIQSNTPVSDRYGTLLQHMRAGDTLLGLTSCSGFTPSQSRSRIAQRR